jgi:hypothetical protein
MTLRTPIASANPCQVRRIRRGADVVSSVLLASLLVACVSAPPVVDPDTGTRKPEPDDVSLAAEPLPAVYAVVHAAPSLGDVRLCFRVAVDGPDLLPMPWPTEGTIPRSNYPGLAAGRGAVLREAVALEKAESIVADVYSAQDVAANDQPTAVSCAALRTRNVTKKATLGPVSLGAAPALLAITECGGAGCPGGAPAELTVRPLAATAMPARVTVQAALLTRDVGPAPVDLQWGEEPIAQGMGFGEVSSPREVTIADGGFENVRVTLSSPSSAWTLAEVQAWSDPGSVPSSFFSTKGLFVLAIVGESGGAGVAALHPVIVPIDVAKGG